MRIINSYKNEFQLHPVDFSNKDFAVINSLHFWHPHWQISYIFHVMSSVYVFEIFQSEPFYMNYSWAKKK